MERLDAAKENCLDQINATFQRIQAYMDNRKKEIIDALKTTCAEKKRVLEEQHSLIECEKNKVNIGVNSRNFFNVIAVYNAFSSIKCEFILFTDFFI